jgi:DNA mismatch endonuclease (patch repair protein)
VADHLSREGRSRVMAQIRSTNTGPELALRRGLYASGVRGWRCNVRSLPGKPDLAFIGLKVAVFCDGAFWHGHPDHFSTGQSGDYWDEKIARTRERDEEANNALQASGWIVIRIWDFEIRRDLDHCVSLVDQAVTTRRRAGAPIPS